MKTFKTFAGIDISKTTIDITFMNADATDKTKHLKINNDIKTIAAFVDKITKVEDLQNTLFTCEHTGVYTMPFITVMHLKQLNYWVVPAIEIKRSQGLHRGKNDKADSKMIALYALTHQHQYIPSILPEAAIQQLKLLFTEREKILKAIALFERSQENESYLHKDVFAVIKKLNRQQIDHLNKALLQVEKQLLLIIKQHNELNKQYELLTSVPGIGKQTAIYLIITTRSFKAFKTWRQMACYAGVAPFEYSSGTSIKGRSKVNHVADKKMKSMLQMCVLSAIKHDAEIKHYYEKKKAEGKHVMLVMNNIRCKLLARAFAVINRATPFVNTQKFAA